MAFAPTGSGKTIMAAQIIADAISRSRRVMFVIHRDILANQTAQKLYSFAVECGFIKSGWQENRKCLVQIASVQTLYKRDWWRKFPADLVILDECHLVAFASVVQQMMHEIYPQAIFLGLTASPWRTLKREGNGDIFQSVVSAPMPFELINQGFLIKPSYFSVTRADLEKVGTAADGDFNEGQLALACDRPELVQQIVQDWMRLAYGRRTIAFAVNVRHSQHLAEAFQAAGVNSAHIDGSTPPKLATQIYEQLAAGDLKIISSCMKLVEGFDLPAVSAILLCRPTQSRALHTQMIGRALRLSPETEKYDAVIVDQAGNIQRHGKVEDLKEISLDIGEEPQKTQAPKKFCPPEQGGCGAIMYASQMSCPHCAYVFPKPKKVYFVPMLQQLLSEEDFERYEFYRQHIRLAYERNFAPGWAAITFKNKYIHWPPEAWASGAVFGEKPTADQQLSYLNYLQAIATRKEKPESWVERYMNLEFGMTLPQPAHHSSK